VNERRRSECLAAGKLRAWLAEGAPNRLMLTRADFPEDAFSLTELLASFPPRERLCWRWRSFCAWMGRYTPFCGWKTFWFRRAGASIGKNVFISPGASLDLLFPQLIVLEEDVVLGLDAMLVCHVYTPERIVIGRVIAKKRSLVGGRGILAIAAIGEEGVLAANSYTLKTIPAGATGIGVPAVIRPRKSSQRKDDAP
jgi:acetyltransferase-like isoleucine patch superfamily enzyme